MATVLEGSKVGKGPKATCAGTCLGSELRDAGSRVEKGVHKVKEAASETLADGKIAAERLLKHGRYAVEDGVEEVVHQIKRNPVRSLAIAFAAGAPRSVFWRLASAGRHTSSRRTSASSDAEQASALGATGSV